MRKVAQDTKFDEMMDNQSDPYGYRSGPTQRLLFPRGDYEWEKEEKIKPVEKEREPLDLRYPQLSPEQIKGKPISPEQRAQIEQQIVRLKENAEQYTYSREHYLQEAQELQDLLDKDDSQLEQYQQDVYKLYQNLQQVSEKFYVAYQEANELANTTYGIDYTASYIDLFADFGELLVARLTKQIGYLFGQSMSKRRFDRYLNVEVNVFNINNANYKEVRNRIKHITMQMSLILEDYEKRKKLLKYLKPKVEEQINSYLANPAWVEFLQWMEEYFPYHKKEMISSVFQRIDTYGKSNKYNYDRISLEDIASFKSFKSVYERAQNVSTKGFQSSVEYSISNEIETTLREEIAKTLKSKVIKLFEYVDFINSKNSTLTPSEKCEQVLNFLRRHFNIDIRALFTFAQKAVKKQDEEWIKLNSGSQNLTKEDIERMTLAESANFFNHFLQQLEQNINTFVSRDKNSGQIVDKWQVGSTAADAAHRIAGKLSNKTNPKNLQEWSAIVNLSPSDLDKLVSQILLKYILASIEGFTSIYSGSERRGRRINFDGIREMVQASGGKFSIEALSSYVHSECPFIPKELLMSTIKIALGEANHNVLNTLQSANSSNKPYLQSILLACKVLQKEKKFDSNNFYRMLKSINTFKDSVVTISRNMPRTFSDEDTVSIMVRAVRSSQTLQNDLDNLNTFAEFIHNEASGLSDEVVKKIISNDNFINFNKLGIVKKLFKSYIQIVAKGGLEGLLTTFPKLIPDLARRGYIAKNFKDNIKMVITFFESNEEINPKSPLFSKLFEVASQIETDLSVLQMGDALQELIKGYKPKNKNLYALDETIRDDIRFRVLKDKDPRILRIGIETNCCQRIGGAGEIAARDSFMNPLASVVVLEWKDPEDNDWKLLSQSYFHFVPKDKSYILDNVETNAKNVDKFKEKTSISLEEVYAFYASKIKEKLDVKYFLAGKGYSKIDPYKFSTDSRAKDPRYFDDRALTRYSQHHYSDYDENNGIDLLAPRFDVNDVVPKLQRLMGKEAMVRVRRFINALMNPGLMKIAQVTENQDIRRLQGVNAKLFGPRSWEFVNELMNEINSGLAELGEAQKLGNQTLNFQAVTRNPTASTRYSGSLKHLFGLSLSLWNVVTAERDIYSVPVAQKIASSLRDEVNSKDFSEPGASEIKTRMINILNNWLSILQ